MTVLTRTGSHEMTERRQVPSWSVRRWQLKFSWPVLLSLLACDFGCDNSSVVSGEQTAGQSKSATQGTEQAEAPVANASPQVPSKNEAQPSFIQLVTLARNFRIKECLRQIEQSQSDGKTEVIRLTNSARLKLQVHEVAAMASVANDKYVHKLGAPCPLRASYFQGDQNYEQGIKPLLASAKEDIERALKVDGGNAQLLCLSAKALIEEGDLEQAIQQLNRAIQTDSNDAVALALRARALRLDGNDSASRRDLLAADKLNSKDADYWSLRANGHDWSAHTGLTAAAEDYRRAIEREPMRIPFYAYRGQALQQLGNLTEAESVYRAGLKLDPNNSQLSYQIGSLFDEKSDAARGAWMFAIDRDPILREAWLDVASASQNRNLNKELFKVIVKNWPDFVPAHLKLYLVADELGDYETALKAITRVIELDSTNWLHFYFRAYIQQEVRRYDEALIDIESGLKIKPEDVALLTLRGRTLAKKDDHKSAVRDLSRAVQLAPNDFYARLCRGLSFVELKRFAEAKEDFDKAVELDPEHAHALALSGLARMAVGEVEEGRQRLEKALNWCPKLDSQRAVVLSAYGDAWTKSGHPDKAKEYYQQAEKIRRK